MIHPLDWSFNSIKAKIVNCYKELGNTLMDTNDLMAYKLLPVKDKIVLDVGAYNGDSAKLFLILGAKHVICIEQNSDFAKQICLKNTTVINESFSIKHLKLNYDVMKMDIEGYEALLLPYLSFLKLSVIEVHNYYLKEQFTMGGFNTIIVTNKILGQCLMKNF